MRSYLCTHDAFAQMQQAQDGAARLFAWAFLNLVPLFCSQNFLANVVVFQWWEILGIVALANSADLQKVGLIKKARF